MIVPQPRLVLCSALVLVPFACLLGATPAVAASAGAVIALFALMVIVDAARARFAGANLQVILPPLVRMQKDQPGEIEVAIERESERDVEVRLGFAFPDSLGAEQESERIRLAGESKRYTVSWNFHPTERGAFQIEHAFLEFLSPLRFWAVRKSCAVRCEARVYPNLHDDRKTVAALFLRRTETGAHNQNFSGQGREFDKLRTYQPGDSLGDIHWKTSAKRRSLVSKVFEIERTHEVYVLIDASRLSGRDLPRASDHPNRDQSRTILERYVSAALILGRAAEQQGDRFGLITFSDRVLSFVRARNGQAHYDAIRERLYDLQPQTVSPDFEELCSFVRLRLRKRALLIILTNLDDPVVAETFVRASDLISRQHLLLVSMIRRPGVHPLFEETERVRDAGDLYGELAGHLLWRRLRELEKVLQRRGVRFFMPDESGLVPGLIKQHADIRNRQLV